MKIALSIFFLACGHPADPVPGPGDDCSAPRTPCEQVSCCARHFCAAECTRPKGGACIACLEEKRAGICLGVADACDPPVRDLYFSPKDGAVL